jgi:hypothetical protein
VLIVQHRRTQRDRVLTLLRARAGSWVPLPEILALGVAQYGSRILELRRLGYRIENRQQAGRSWFRLVTNRQASLPFAAAQYRDPEEG